MINYPKIKIRSKNELAKCLSSGGPSYNTTLRMINDVRENKDKYWRDNKKHSNSEKGKITRDASFSKYGKLLKEIDRKVLAPHDQLLPKNIFYGASKRSIRDALIYLDAYNGGPRQRTLLALDLEHFFEQIKLRQVQEFLMKCGCRKKGAKLLSNLCCVPLGPKGEGTEEKVLARGFATSPRLSMWCNIEFFKEVRRIANRELAGHDPRVVIYADDIGISASKVEIKEMVKLRREIEKVADKFKLKLNKEKTKIKVHSGEAYDGDGKRIRGGGYEFLGVRMDRTGLRLGAKSHAKKMKARNGELTKVQKRGILGYEHFLGMARG